MYVIPDLMTMAASDLTTIGADVNAAHLAAATHTVGLIPAAADEVSAGITQVFSRYAEDFHRLAGQASAFHDQFVGNLKAGAASYTGAEAANAASFPSLVQTLENLPTIPSLVQTLENLPVVGSLLSGVFAILGISLFLLILVTLWILQSVENFLGQFGL
jgi:hypothetical protein